MDVELGKYQSGDPDKIDKFTTVLAQLTPDQMNRYESFRRSGFQKANMRRVLQSIAGCPISIPMTIVMSGIAKMFVGELVEMGRMVMPPYLGVCCGCHPQVKVRDHKGKTSQWDLFLTQSNSYWS